MLCYILFDRKVEIISKLKFSANCAICSCSFQLFSTFYLLVFRTWLSFSQNYKPLRSTRWTRSSWTEYQ